MDTYAKIQSGVVVNTQVINPTIDYLDPAYTWVDINGLTCTDGSPIQIGCGYNGTVFSPSS
jgi:hypothetical protein